MPQLRVRTRGESSPAGKPKVYFCCHPGDFAESFDGICNAILGLQNCAIYYKDNPSEATDEELLFDLGQMNLFVVPVTARLLLGRCPATDSDIPFALARHIPLLPIVFEPGLEQPFTLLFGTIQYLKRFEPDPTEIPYEQKLATFLSAVIIGDELSDKVRSAFDAYIFLSYRKKDRHQAQRLMELIHQDVNLRDVAIWYDEFLVPGEDFNDFIAHALEKSDVFTLAVTPNLVNEANYVMNVEYPMARKSKKPIVPVEMIETDKSDLRRGYAGIPDPVSADDADELSSLIVSKLGHTDLSRKDNSNHRFLIGLAYLQGIDVEKNVVVGLSMVTEAANAGLTEAIEKLANMYYYGDGVEQDIGKAIEWQKQLSDKYADIAEESRNDRDAVAFIVHRIRCGEMQYESGRFQDAAKSFEVVYKASKALALGTMGKGVLQRLAGVVRRFTTRSEYYYDGTYYMVRSARMAMQAYFIMGMDDVAAEWGIRAVSSGKSNSMFEGEERSAHELVAAYGTMGTLYLEVGNLERAREEFAHEVDAIPETDDFNAELTEVHACLHHLSLAEAEGDTKGAAEYGKYAIGRLRALYEEFRTEPEGWTVFPELFQLHLRMSLLCQRANALNEASKILDDALSLLDEDDVCASADKLDYFHDVVTLHRGSILLDSGRSSDAKSLLLETVDDMRVFVAERSISLENLDDMSYVYRLLGDCCIDLGEYLEATDWLEKAYDGLRGHMLFTKSVRATKMVAALCEKLFDTYNTLGISSLAKQWYLKAEWCLQLIAQITGLDSDRKNHQELLRKKSLLSLGASQQAPSVEMGESLRQYVTAHDRHLGDIYPDFPSELEIGIGQVMVDYFEQNQMFNGSPLFYKIYKLGSVLSDRKHNREISLLDRIGSVELEIPEIARALTADYERNVFIRYDEQACLILSYCRYYQLFNKYASVSADEGGSDSTYSIARRMIEKELADFRRFFLSLAFWEFPIEKLVYRKQWQLVFHMVHRGCRPGKY